MAWGHPERLEDLLTAFVRSVNVDATRTPEECAVNITPQIIDDLGDTESLKR